MKKVLSMILVLAMMLSLVTVASVTSTAEEVTANAGQLGVVEAATGAKAPGVIKTDGTELSAEKLATQLAAGGTYHMTGNIDAGTTALTVATNTTIYGNGYTLKLGASLTVADNATVTFENIKFETTNSLIGVVCGVSISFTDCTRIGDISSSSEKVGGYIGALSGAASTVIFTNCINDGIVKTTNHRAGGFIGTIWDNGSSNVTFTQCTNAKAVEGNQQVGGFVGASIVAATIGFENCKNADAGAVTGTKHAGGLIGRFYSPNSAITFTNCENSGTVETTIYEYAGGFSGDLEVGASASFLNCVNSGAISSAKTSAGGFVGRVVPSVLTFENCENRAAVDSTTDFAAGFVGEFRGTSATLKDCTNNGAVNGGADSLGQHYNGGFIGYGASAELTFTNCHNTNTVKSAKGSCTAGLVGYVGGNSTFTNCSNKGAISGPQRMGGLVGEAGKALTFKNCVNRASVTSSGTQVGGFVGKTTAASTFENCVNDGAITGSTSGVWVAAESTVTPTTTACANTVDDATTATAAPIYGGVQETAPANGVQKIRFLATVNSLKYHEVGFKVTVTANGVTGDTQTHAATYAYLTAKAGDTVETAKSLGGGAEDYIYTLTITDVPTTAGEIVFTIQTYVKNAADGKEILGAEQTVTYVNGEYQDPTAAN